MPPSHQPQLNPVVTVAVLRLLALACASIKSTQARVDVNLGPVEAALALAGTKDPVCGRQCRPWHLNQGHYFIDAPVCLVPMPCNAINAAHDNNDRGHFCTAIQLLHTDSTADRPRCNCTYRIPEEPVQWGAFRLGHLDAPPPGATMFPGVGLVMHERYHGVNLWHAMFHYLPSIRMLQLFAARLQPRGAQQRSQRLRTERAQLVRIHDASPTAPWGRKGGNWTDEFYQLLPKFAQSLLVGDVAYVEIDKETVQSREPACYESMVAGHPPIFEWEGHKDKRMRTRNPSGSELPGSIEAYGPRDYDLMRAGFFELFGVHERSANLNPAMRRMVLNQRMETDRRAFTNAESILEVLSALGQSEGWQAESTTFVPGKTMAQQLAVSIKADIVVAAHGQGLAWYYFLPPGSIVVEIMPSTARGGSECRGLTTNTNLNYAKAQFMGVMHFCFVHAAVVPTGDDKTWRSHNIEVDTELLARQVSWAVEVTEEARLAGCLYYCKRCANWKPNAAAP